MWGSQQRQYAQSSFFLFTLAGSLLTFLGLLAIVLWHYYHPHGQSATWKMTFSIPELTRDLRLRPSNPAVQMFDLPGPVAGFAIKVPLFPLHTWLPLAHGRGAGGGEA